MSRINLLARILLCFLFVFLPLKPLDQWFYDLMFRLRGRLTRPTSIVLVRINDTRLQDQNSDLRMPTVWYHRFYDPLLKIIQADNPKLVVFSSFFDRTDSKEPPPKYGNLFFSAILNEENKFIPPPRTLTVGDNFGYSNIFRDPDNIVRRSRLVYALSSSLALRVYQRLQPGPIQRDLLEPIWVDFRGPAGSYPSVNGWDVVEDSSSFSGRFADKIVLVGREGSDLSDAETPFGHLSRLEIQANILGSLLEQRALWHTPHSFSTAVAVVSILASISIILYFPLTLAWLFLVLYSLALVLLGLFAFSTLKVWVGLANPLIAILGTHLVMLGYKLSRQEEQQWKIQQESEYLKDLDQFKNNFISLFSHDLKTPIAKIKAITDRLLAAEGSLNEEARESLRTIDKTSSELARFISDILKVTKMESMSLELAKGVLDLNRLVEEAVQRLRFLSDEKEIQTILDLEPLFSMEGDQNLIQEVITNLVENAIKYSPSKTRVVIRTREDNERVHISIVDEGVGIPPDELPRVTGKFYRGKFATEKVKGSGLGLYLAKYFVELHHGRLDIRSSIGRGTEVHFWLPLQQPVP